MQMGAGENHIILTFVSTVLHGELNIQQRPWRYWSDKQREYLKRKGKKVMWSRLYDITMQTPIGNRYGSMNVTVNQNHVDGILTILKKATPFDGSICEDGNCRISGQLITLMRTIPYDAVGRITKSSLWLILKGEQETFEVSGSVSDSNVSAPKEQAL